MSAGAHLGNDTPISIDDSTAKAAGVWINLLGRTLKTCRLYDAHNPTVVRFREELATALRRLLDEHGAITFRFTSEDVFYQETSLYPARSRDDNLALPFHRDGVRAVTFSPGIESQEVHALVDAVLQVSGQNFGHDDLVTLLWEAHLQHLDVDYVPSDSDFGGGPGESALDESQGVPWPGGASAEAEEEEEKEKGGETVVNAAPAEGGSRSDDWTTGDLTVEIEAGFEELDALAPTEAERLRREFEAEHAVSPSTTALAIIRAVLSADVTNEDRTELSAFVPRLLRLAIARGAWLEVREAFQLIRDQGAEGWTVGTFAQELLQPISISTTVEHLDRQTSAEVLDFIAFAGELDDSAVDLLNLVLAESQQRRNRRLIAEAIADRCRDRPERLAPWLSDRRWYVVRNVVHILGWIGGEAIVGMLKSVLRHPEPRVRQEVVAALGGVDPKLARPLLLRMLDHADARMFAAVLYQLSTERDTETAQLLLGYLQNDSFESRPPEAKRAIYSALSAVGTDDIIPELEAELLKGNWFVRGQELHRQSVARCIARIGTPLARMVLERGALSKRGPVHKACEDALAGFTNRG